MKQITSKLALFCIVATAFLACDAKRQTTPDEPTAVAASDPVNTTESKAFESPPKPKSDVEDFDSLVRDTPRSTWLEKWGPPKESLSFLMGEGMPEFRVELLNDFKPDDPKSANVEIQEDTWDLGDYFFTLWSYKKEGVWVSIQAVGYSKDVEF